MKSKSLPLIFSGKLINTYGSSKLDILNFKFSIFFVWLYHNFKLFKFIFFLSENILSKVFIEFPKE